MQANSLSLFGEQLEQERQEFEPSSCFLSTAAEHPRAWDECERCLRHVCDKRKCKIGSFSPIMLVMILVLVSRRRVQWIKNSPSLLLPSNVVNANLFPVERKVIFMFQKDHAAIWIAIRNQEENPMTIDKHTRAFCHNSFRTCY
jgi:hypothetical protein